MVILEAWPGPDPSRPARALHHSSCCQDEAGSGSNCRGQAGGRWPVMTTQNGGRRHTSSEDDSAGRPPFRRRPQPGRAGGSDVVVELEVGPGRRPVLAALESLESSGSCVGRRRSDPAAVGRLVDFSWTLAAAWRVSADRSSTADNRPFRRDQTQVWHGFETRSGVSQQPTFRAR
jgi:hypothetical protein